MKRFIVVNLMFFLFTGIGLAKGKPIIVSGIIVDNMCATANKENLAAFIPSHTKECALMPDCSASGYSLYMDDGKLTPFTKEGSLRVKAFLKNTESKLKVTVTGEKSGKYLKIINIQNQ